MCWRMACLADERLLQAPGVGVRVRAGPADRPGSFDHAGTFCAGALAKGSLCGMKLSKALAVHVDVFSTVVVTGRPNG